ncbi:MAG: CHAD domain-containing protein [Chitinophagales bacterium]|nr:CHAD domain-containing protein [Chitinophagales bacterium]
MEPFFSLQTNFEELHKKCKVHLRYYSTKQHPEHLHKLRVTIKRIKALFRLANAADTRFNNDKFYKPYRKLFKAAGKIREAQVHIQNLQLLTGKKRSAETEQLKRGIRQMNAAFVSMQVDFISSIDKRSEEIGEKLKRIKSARLQKCFATDLKQICKRVYAIRRADKLHSFRKKLKRLMYNNELTSAKNRMLTRSYLKAIDDLQDTIGKWHDAELLKFMAMQEVSLKNYLPALEKQCDKLLMETERLLSLLRQKCA